eukprot:scaffold298895_cov31-Tisochrysis_lutea.AAC.1
MLVLKCDRRKQRARRLARTRSTRAFEALGVQDLLASCVTDGGLQRGREDTLVSRTVARRQQELAQPFNLSDKGRGIWRGFLRELKGDARLRCRNGACALGH